MLARVRGTYFNTNVVRRIIKRASSFDTICRGRTALSEALYVGNDGFAAMLIAHGANVNIVQPDATFALFDIARTSGLFGSTVRARSAILALLDVLFSRVEGNTSCDPFPTIPSALRFSAAQHSAMPMNVIDFLISMTSPTEQPTLALAEALMGLPVYKKIVDFMRKSNVQRVADTREPVPMCEECGRRYGVELHAWRAWYCCCDAALENV